MSRRKGGGERIRRAILALGRRGRTERIPRAIRARVIAYAQQGRREGRSWRQLAEGVGLATYTVQRWVKIADGQGGARRTMVPVRIEAKGLEREQSGLVMITPSGVRLEGLGPEEAVAVLRALG